MRPPRHCSWFPAWPPLPDQRHGRSVRGAWRSSQRGLCFSRGRFLTSVTWEVPSASGAWRKSRTNRPKPSLTLRMRLWWARGGTMWLRVLLTLLLCSSLEGQENPFTINSIHMLILPKQEVQNGENLTLQCVVDVSTTSSVKPQHQVLFYKDDVLFHNASSMENTESYFIPQARVYDAGIYKCTVILNNKEKTTAEYPVLVRGVSDPRVTLDKKEVIEGGVVMVNCSVPEEKAPIHFTVEKFELNVKGVKQKREKTSQHQNFVTLKFTVEEQDQAIWFQCQARIVSGTHVEPSRSIRSELVTVRESFSNPKFHISPKGTIIEGDDLHIKCTIQVTHLAQSFPEIIIQKDKAIVAHSRHGNEAVYSVMATVEHNGNYTCKVEASRISKVSSIVVNITELFSKPKLESSATRLDQGEGLNLWCSIPGAPPANFTIQKGGTVVSQAQNFTKIASEWDSGTYTCVAGIGKVVKSSNAVQIAVCEMLSKPSIFHDSRSEVIKGQTIEVSCQSINGTSPIFYQLSKASKTLASQSMGSNEPAIFKDNPTKDVEYQCIADNCHSHTKLVSELLQVKVIAPVDEVKLSILLNEEVESGKPIVLRCSVNEGSSPITYKFYKEKEGKPFHQVTLNDTQAIWHKPKASKEQEGQYYCTASNRANLSKNVLQSNTLTVRAKQMPVEMSRPAAPLLNSNNEKTMSDPSTEANRHYGYNEDVGNHAMKPLNENKEPLTLDVEYTEVEVTAPEPHRGNTITQGIPHVLLSAWV
ncbi:platelet endothelial cell adhesion molecule isoform X2 [Physeter macrocephalus]|uniref:Platelet endothelial cell adhesion molecule n=1 Tax=Physeter macrocephalus TaxID=9755 RepID=A0A455C118_PHYMC|nr:platelet endothelial cell adhesion molecule isoform X2 [Physeter catodon]|eukprot:XP_028355044.1 platelet endothelial cell adhesion molecule isoform X2 [Physeter catodon]